jgi:glycosyltransferase involved in cell wall biosynthesis
MTQISTIKVSIILPTYNRSKILPQAIESCLRQTHPDFELIIVDDGSSDDTEAVIKRYASVDPRIRCIRNPHNLGLSKALNVGLAHATGAYITFLDDDGEYLPERLEIRLSMIEHLSPKPVLSYSNIWDEAVGAGMVYPQVKEDKFVTLHDVLAGAYHFTGQMTWLAERSFFLRYNFDENLDVLQDIDLLLRAIAHGEYIFYFNRPLGIHHAMKGMSSISCDNILKRERFIKKHMPLIRMYHGYLSRFYYCLGKDSIALKDMPNARKFFIKAFFFNAARLDYLVRALSSF